MLESSLALARTSRKFRQKRMPDAKRGLRSVQKSGCAERATAEVMPEKNTPDGVRPIEFHLSENI